MSNEPTGMSFVVNYVREIEQHWKYKESQRRMYKFMSPQLHFRSYLVLWLKNVSQKLKVSYRTLHLALYILDSFMDNHSIVKERLGFVALVCLMLAAKFEEIDGKVPTISELNKYDGCRYSSRDFISVEVMVLKFLDFDLTQPTIAHFAEYYAMATIVPQDLSSITVPFRLLRERAISIVQELLDICVEEMRFIQQPPSKVAAACIMAVRKYLKLSPIWPSLLQEISGYTEQGLSNCTRLLLYKYHLVEEAKKNSPDAGYNSD